MSTRIVERHGIRRLIPKCRQYFRPIVPLQYVWLNRKKGAAMNQTDKVLYTAAVHTAGGRKARGCVGTAARRRWQSQEPLPLGVWSRKPSARRPVELEVIFELAW